MNCKHEWLVPSDKRTRCKRCGDDGWVSHDGKVHETYEACMKHDVMAYAASPFSLPTQSGHSPETTPKSGLTDDELRRRKIILGQLDRMREDHLVINEMGKGRILQDVIQIIEATTVQTQDPVTLISVSESTKIEKPQENCPTRDECADMYSELRKAQKRIAELERMVKETSLENERLRVAHYDSMRGEK